MMGELSPGAAVAIGVLVGLVSTTVQSIGLTLQRKSHLLEDEKEDEYDKRPPYRRRRWQVGMSMFLIANIVGSTVQITTLPLPVLSTLQASGLVFNTICATLILKEPFTKYSLLGTILVAVGAVLIGIFGAMTEPSHNLQQLLSLLGRGSFLIWLVGTFLFAAGFALTAWFSHRIWPRGHSRIRLMQGMLYGAVSGILSAHTLLVAKSAVELLVRTIVDQHNQFNRWQSWFILLALLALALSQLYFLHLGLKLCSTSVLYPFVFCLYNIVAILDGLIYFRQTSRLTALHAGLIALGTAVLLVGVVSLSWRLEESSAYSALASNDHGHGQRVRSMSRLATPAMPQTVLAPGMGIVEGTPTTATFEDEENDDETTTPQSVADEESGLRGQVETSGRARETTPLLLTTSTPNLSRQGLASPVERQRNAVGGSLKPSKRRKTVTAPTVDVELWDELIENDVYRRRSMDFGTMASSLGASNLSDLKQVSKSPGTVRFDSRPKSSSSGRMRMGNGQSSTRHGRSASTSSGSQLLGPQGWRFWDSHTPRQSNRSRADKARTNDADDGLETPLTSSSHAQSGSAIVASPAEESHAEWLKLSWWKQPWKNKTREENAD